MAVEPGGSSITLVGERPALFACTQKLHNPMIGTGEEASSQY